mmetsp:Transcript_7703/g.19019  ORF Transcript_7703/g.19019 Transcript_7703/m.19019 type:complete len:278 (+) Transcript_7703:1201-2034(+)
MLARLVVLGVHTWECFWLLRRREELVHTPASEQRILRQEPRRQQPTLQWTRRLLPEHRRRHRVDRHRVARNLGEHLRSQLHPTHVLGCSDVVDATPVIAQEHAHNRGDVFSVDRRCKLVRGKAKRRRLRIPNTLLRIGKNARHKVLPPLFNSIHIGHAQHQCAPKCEHELLGLELVLAVHRQWGGLRILTVWTGTPVKHVVGGDEHHLRAQLLSQRDHVAGGKHILRCRLLGLRLALVHVSHRCTVDYHIGPELPHVKVDGVCHVSAVEVDSVRRGE